MRETTRMMLLGLTGSLAMTTGAFADKGDSHFVVEDLFGTGTNNVNDIVPAGIDLVIDVSGTESWDGPGDPDNVVNTYNIGANAHVTGLAYDVTISTINPSWLSEATVGLTDSGVTDGVNLAPGTGDNFAGTMSYSGSVDLIAAGLDFNVGPDGVLRAEFFESFNDFTDGIDGFWTDGTITVTYVPAPGAFALLGLGGLACARRRRH